MWRLPLFPASIYLAAIVEPPWERHATIGNAAPDLFVLVACLWMLLAGGGWGVAAAMGCGLAADLMTSGRVGGSTALLILLWLLVERVRHWALGERFALRVAAIALLVASYTLVLGLLRAATGAIELTAAQVATHACGVALYTAVVAIPTLWILRWLGPPTGAIAARSTA